MTFSDNLETSHLPVFAIVMTCPPYTCPPYKTLAGGSNPQHSVFANEMKQSVEVVFQLDKYVNSYLLLTTIDGCIIGIT
jgi:hypothetical protein